MTDGTWWPTPKASVSMRSTPFQMRMRLQSGWLALIRHGLSGRPPSTVAAWGPPCSRRSNVQHVVSNVIDTRPKSRRRREQPHIVLFFSGFFPSALCVLLGFTGFHSITQFRHLLMFTCWNCCFSCASLGFSRIVGFHLVLRGFTGFYWVLLGFTRFHSIR